MDKLQEQIAQHFAKQWSARLFRVLKVNQADSGEFIELVGELSLIELVNGVFVVEGRSDTIGAYAGAVRFVVDVCGSDEAWRKPKPEVMEIEPQATVH
jgi:hypothetical protein